MKIRTSFVSNSSSASYLVTIFENKEELFDTMIKNFCIIQELKEEFKNTINNNLRDWQKSLGEYLLKPSELTKIWISQIEENINKSELLIEKFNRHDYVESYEIIDDILEYNNIDISESDDQTNISYFTVMHNDFYDDMPDLLKEIILFYQFYKSNKIKCTIEE